MAALMMVTGCGNLLASAQPDPVVSREEFEQVFPGHSPFYTYDGLMAATPNFASRREAAAFMANVYHETGGLTIVNEAMERRQGYCDSSEAYGCPAGRDAYFGRGPLQLSWNYNYKEAGEALGLDLLRDPSLVERDSRVAWATAVWFWSNRVPRDADFGETIRAINGLQECDGGNPAQVGSRVTAYLRIADLLDVSPGGNLSC